MAKCVAALGCPQAKIRVHHLGVDVDAIRFAPRRWKQGQPLRVLMAAAFREKKGLPFGLAALGKLRKDVDLEITLIGDANREPRSQQEKRRILTTIERHGLGSRVRQLGYQPYRRLLEEAYQHHIFLAPSVTSTDGDTEGGAPVTLIDLAASGMPIVSTRHCDIPNLVEDGVTGLLANERDVEGLVENLRRLVREPDAWESMAAAGRHRVESEFNARTQGRRLRTVYQTVVESNASPDHMHVTAH